MFIMDTPTWMHMIIEEHSSKEITFQTGHMTSNHKDGELCRLVSYILHTKVHMIRYLCAQY